MTITVTAVSDVIVPELFAAYVIEEPTVTNKFFTSGIVAPFTPLSPIGERGQLVNMPFWQDLAGDAQVLDSATTLDVSAIDTGKDVAVLLGRALVYGSTDLAGDLAGSDPMAALQARYALKWNEEMNKEIVNIVTGSLGALALASVNTLDISALSGTAAQADGDSMMDAQQQLGDMKSKLTAIGMHSEVENHLAKRGLIDYLQEQDGSPFIPFYQGKRVIVDDALAPESGGIYTTIFFGEGAIGYTEGTPKVPVEVERDALRNSGEEYLVSRRHFVLHPRGIKWSPGTGVPAKDSPSRAELADTGNWAQEYQAKNIRMVKFVHKIA